MLMLMMMLMTCHDRTTYLLVDVQTSARMCHITSKELDVCIHVRAPWPLECLLGDAITGSTEDFGLCW